MKLTDEAPLTPYMELMQSLEGKKKQLNWERKLNFGIRIEHWTIEMCPVIITVNNGSLSVFTEASLRSNSMESLKTEIHAYLGSIYQEGS